MTLYCEISPLQEENFTGVSVVTERLADAFIRKLGGKAKFFLRDQIIPHDLVQELLVSRNGGFLRDAVGLLALEPAPMDFASYSYGFFPNQKTQWNRFTVEAQVIHDLSTILTPEFHRRETVAMHAPALLRELRSNTTTFCVSQATAEDCDLYLNASAHTSLQLLVEGCDWDPSYAARFEQYVYAGAKPFVLVLATIEPRKNIDALLSLTARRPDILRTYDLVFLGRSGWGEAMRMKLARFGLAERLGENILAPGFVSEFTKYVLLRQASFVVYPSILEGFGLPVLEALSLGKHVLASISSSITEVGGDACVYFDPNFPETFEAAFDAVEERLRGGGENTDGRQQAALFSWDRGADIVIADYERHAVAYAALS